MRLGAATLVAVALVTVVPPTTTPARAALRSGALTHSGVWTLDSRGRVVITHGVNVVHKVAPFYPNLFDAQDARFLVGEGFNAARIGFIWEGAEPNPGVYDDAYIRHVAAFNALLAQYGIDTLVDFHQDSYGSKYGGDGAPAWASVDAGGPASASLGGALQAFQHLWNDDAAADGVGLREHFAGAWQRAAAQLAGAGNILGYDLFNEPYAGDQSPCAAFNPCPTFESGELAAFYRALIPAVRSRDAEHLIYYEPVPQLLGVQTFLPSPLTSDPALGFTYHFYARDCGAAPQPTDPTTTALQNQRCMAEESQALDAGRTYAVRAGAAADFGEFGDTTNDVDVAEMVDLADQRLLPWSYWSFNTEGSSLAPGLAPDPSKHGVDADQAKLDSLVVPYPQQVAGTPTSYAYDRTTNTMRLTFSTSAAGPISLCHDATTEIFVPRRHYPTGYQVAVSGAHVVSPAPTWPWVELVNDSGAATVSVTITPRTGSTTDVSLQAGDPAPANTAECPAAPAGSRGPAQAAATSSSALPNTAGPQGDARGVAVVGLGVALLLGRLRRPRRAADHAAAGDPRRA